MRTTRRSPFSTTRRRTRERAKGFYVPEIWRVRGRIFARSASLAGGGSVSPGHRPPAARARSLELRAALDLGELLNAEGPRRGRPACLAAVVDDSPSAVDRPEPAQADDPVSSASLRRQEPLMSDDQSPLPWTSQQWADLRAVAQESARNSRVASTFLPLVGPLPKDQATVPSNWMTVSTAEGRATRRGSGPAGGPLGQDASPGHDLMQHLSPRFRGRRPRLRCCKGDGASGGGGTRPRGGRGRLPRTPRDANIRCLRTHHPVVRPLIYKLTGGRDLTGLLQAADTDFNSLGEKQGSATTPAE